jgi:hypothetical protein
MFLSYLCSYCLSIYARIVYLFMLVLSIYFAILFMLVLSIYLSIFFMVRSWVYLELLSNNTVLVPTGEIKSGGESKCSLLTVWIATARSEPVELSEWAPVWICPNAGSETGDTGCPNASLALSGSTFNKNCLFFDYTSSKLLSCLPESSFICWSCTLMSFYVV